MFIDVYEHPGIVSEYHPSIDEFPIRRMARQGFAPGAFMKYLKISVGADEYLLKNKK